MQKIEVAASGENQWPTATQRWSVMVIAFCLSLFSATAVPPPSGVAPVLVPVGGFSIDGDVLANVPLSNTGDWVSGTNSGSGGGVLSTSGVPLNPATTFHFVDPYSSSSDQTFSGGLKWNDNPNTWQYVSGKPSSKTDINNVLMHIASDAQDHTWTIVAADRASTSGSSYIDFEFLQNTLVKTNGGFFASAGPNGGRTINDLLLSIAFESGGSVANFLAYRWVPDGSGGFAYVDVTSNLPVGRVFVALNSITVAAPYGAFGQKTYAPNAFAEAAVDLTAFLGGFDQCLSMGFKTIMVKTKSSASSSATIEDFLDPIQYSLQIGPGANAGPDQARCTEGPSTAFPLAGKATAGLQPITSTSWSVIAGDAVIESPSSLITTAYVSSASATLRLIALQANGCAETNDVVLTVASIPTSSIAGAASTCPRGTTQFQGPPAMNAYAWSITGNGTISGPTNSQTVTTVAGGCGTNFTLTLKVTSGICSGFSSMDVQVVDTIPPVVIPPPDRVLSCPADTRTNVNGVATAQDSCGIARITYSDSISNICGGAYDIARTWTATDLCGNAGFAVQLISVRDTTRPSLVLPPSLTLECPANTATNSTGVATAQDACSSVVVSFSDSVSNACGGSQVIARLWTAIDQCGNSTNGVQLITVRDTTRPSLALPSDLVLECPADTSTNNTGTAVALDTCSAVTVSFTDSVTNNCGATEIIKRKWTATDACGNATNRTQTITVRDITPPVLTIPPSLVLECPANTTTNNTGVATAVDACSSAVVSFTDIVTNSCGGTKLITRTWSAVDQCGNRANAVQTITVRDSTPPTLTLPGDLVLECPANTGTNVTGVATAADGCGSVTVRFSDVVSNACAGTKIVSRTWTAVDQCGNTTNGLQRITVIDSTPPALTIPSNLVLECPANTTTNSTGVALASDGCGSVVVSYSDVTSNACGNTKVIFRTWLATDQCGNTTNRVQTITIKDSLPPSLSIPANLVLECPANTATNSTGTATAQDGCGSVQLTFSDSVSNACGGTKVISRLWTAVDQCGNTTNRLQTITIRDLTPPVLTVPANLVLECPANTTTNNTGVATATDGCSSVVIGYSDVVSNACGGTKVIIRNWVATDQCGNAVAAPQTITVRDSLAPNLAIPADLVLECPANTTTNNTGAATATDGCGTVVLSYSDTLTNLCAGTKIIVRKWTAVDQCGNTTNRAQTITVRDSTPPSLIIPTNVVLECPAVTSTNITGAATATDGCGTVLISYSDIVSNTCGVNKVIARMWTAIDQCGNTTNRLQTITVRDTIPPSITAPADLVLECPAITTTNVAGVATATDGCGSVAISYSDSVSNTCGSAKTIYRKWTATDQCGNSRSSVQTIAIRDLAPPTITAPGNLVLECPALTTPSATGTATATDGCGSVTISYSDSVTNACGGTKTISRTWTAADGCGNNVSALQTITIRDMTPPSLRLPADRVLQCPGDTRTNVTGSPIVSDGCGSVTVSYSDVVSNSCGTTKTVWRSWTATDQCGNTTNGLQTISVIDTTKPGINFPNISVQCVGDIPPAYTNLAGLVAAGGSASDSCSAALTFALISDSGLIGRCPGTVTRVYRVTDACGNSTDGTQRITVDDTIPPVLACPANSTVECGLALVPANTGRATATDNCSTNIAITYTDGAPLSSQYNLNFYVADPDTNTGPYSATFLQFSPASLPCPVSAGLTGRALDPLRNAVAFAPNGQLDALTSVGNVPVSLGQILPYEVVIQGSGGPGPERGTIDFTAAWSTYTTSNNRFGYDTNYMIYCAFVDAADPGLIDPNANARVVSYSSTIVNPGTIDEAIQATFRVAGIDAGDRVVVEIWVVLDSTMPDHTGGTVNSRLVSAQTAAPTPVQISIGNQTDSLGNLSKIGPLGPPQVQPPLGPLPTQPPALPGATISIFNRSWTATDECGNPSTCAQQITVRDTTPPALTVPPDLFLDCPVTDTSTNTTGTALAQDNCGSVNLYYTDSVTNGVNSTRIVTRTWIATDDAGNSTNAIQKITLGDRTPPALSLPPNLTLDCPANTSTNYTGVAVCTDACHTSSVTYSDATSANGPGTNIIARTWTATDGLNSTSGVQVIIVRDATPPTLTLPPNLTLNCPANPSTNFTGVAVSTDACNTPIVTYSDATSANGLGTNIIARTWTATDGLNSTSGVQVIIVRDATPPALTLPPNLTLGCPANTSTNNTGVAVCTDACHKPIVTYSDVTSVGGPGTNIIARTWNATDGVNSTSAVQFIIVRDATPPTLTLPPNLTLNCLANTSTNNTGVAVSSDACSTPIVTYSDASSTNGPGTNIIARTWTATDGVNSTSAVQVIIIRDNTPPTLTLPPNLTLTCPANTSTNNTGVAVSADACNTPIVTYSDATSANGPGTNIIARTWTATDGVNSTSAVQVIIVRDVTPPTLTLPPNLTLNCPASISTNNTGVAVSTDACHTPIVTYSDATSANGPGTNIIARTWTATDGLNSTSAVQVIIVRDVTPPTLTLPPNLTLNCPASISTNNTGVAVSTDACHTPVVTYSDATSANGPGTNIIARTWTATDGANSVSAVQIITILDITPPSLTCPPNIVLAWPATTSTNTTGAATAVDACSITTVTYSDTVTTNVGMGGPSDTMLRTALSQSGASQTVFRNWTAKDQAGNKTNAVQKITLILGTPPVITSQPQCGSFGCGSNLSLTVTASGTGPLSYQWRLNGASLAGATNSSVTFSSAQYSNAGLYTVLVSNGAGSVASVPAIVNVLPVLYSQRNAKSLTLSWTGPFVLQWASSVRGPFTDVPGAVSPFVYNYSSAPAKFFRLSSQQPMAIRMNMLPSKQVALTLTGPPGNTLVLQASTNLINWVNLQTNTPPFSFTDTQAPNYPVRFYRKVLAQ